MVTRLVTDPQNTGSVLKKQRFVVDVRKDIQSLSVSELVSMKEVPAKQAEA